MSSAAFQGIVKFLTDELQVKTQKEIARFLNITQPQVSSYQTQGPTRLSSWRKLARRLYFKGQMNGKAAISKTILVSLNNTFGNVPQQKLAKALDVTQPTISNWLAGKSVPSDRNFEKLLALYVVWLVEPVIEFKPVQPARSGNGWRFHQNQNEEKKLRQQLIKKHGIYIFYDSTGRVTYVGKADRMNLWHEPKQRLKAKLKRPFHAPEKKKKVVQGDVVKFLSAYQVRVTHAIPNLEVFLLRAFANDHANLNIGHFKYTLRSPRKKKGGGT